MVTNPAFDADEILGKANEYLASHRTFASHTSHLVMLGSQSVVDGSHNTGPRVEILHSKAGETGYVRVNFDVSRVTSQSPYQYNTATITTLYAHAEPDPADLSRPKLPPGATPSGQVEM